MTPQTQVKESLENQLESIRDRIKTFLIWNHPYIDDVNILDLQSVVRDLEKILERMKARSELVKELERIK